MPVIVLESWPRMILDSLGNQSGGIRQLVPGSARPCFRNEGRAVTKEDAQGWPLAAAHRQTCIDVCAHKHTCTHRHTHMSTDAYMHTHTQAYTRTCTPPPTHTHKGFLADVLNRVSVLTKPRCASQAAAVWWASASCPPNDPILEENLSHIAFHFYVNECFTCMYVTGTHGGRKKGLVSGELKGHLPEHSCRFLLCRMPQSCANSSECSKSCCMPVASLRLRHTSGFTRGALPSYLTFYEVL